MALCFLHADFHLTRDEVEKLTDEIADMQADMKDVNAAHGVAWEMQNPWGDANR